MLDLSTLESHADPQVRALVRELRAARDVVEKSEFVAFVLRSEVIDNPNGLLRAQQARAVLFEFDASAQAWRQVHYDAAKEPAE